MSVLLRRDVSRSSELPPLLGWNEAKDATSESCVRVWISASIVLQGAEVCQAIISQSRSTAKNFISFLTADSASHCDPIIKRCTNYDPLITISIFFAGFNRIFVNWTHVRLLSNIDMYNREGVKKKNLHTPGADGGGAIFGGQLGPNHIVLVARRHLWIPSDNKLGSGRLPPSP